MREQKSCSRPIVQPTVTHTHTHTRRPFRAPKYTHSTQDIVIGTRCGETMISPPSSPVILPLPHTRSFYSSPPSLCLACSLFFFCASFKPGRKALFTSPRLASGPCLFWNVFSFSYTSFCPRTQRRKAINTRANVTQTHACVFFSNKWVPDILYSDTLTHTHIHIYLPSSGILEQHKVLSFCLGFEETLKTTVVHIIQA